MGFDLDYWLRRSPYFDLTCRAGARRVTVGNHMYVAGGFGDPIEEYWHLVNGVTLWDVANERQVEVTGPDAASFVDLICTRDIAACPVGFCRYMLFTSAEGGIVNDPVMLRFEQNRFWFSASDSDLLLWIKGIAVFAGFDVTVREPDVAPIQVQGPKSGAIVDALFGERGTALRYYELLETELDGMPVVLTRTGWSGELGYEIFLCDSRYAERLWTLVVETGRPHGLAITGPSDIRRVEAGILGLGHRGDISLSVNPFEAGLDRLVALDKPADFVGKAALRRIRDEGVARRLVGIEIDGNPLPTGSFGARWPVRHDGRAIGEVTVALHSPRLARNIGYAMLEAGATAPGVRIDVETPAGWRTATTAALPLIRRQRTGSAGAPSPNDVPDGASPDRSRIDPVGRNARP
ncbi:MAG: glycine cleavage T C-terminal barrel domain-containing protein [Dongiaceae bacterium]